MFRRRLLLAVVVAATAGSPVHAQLFPPGPFPGPFVPPFPVVVPGVPVVVPQGIGFTYNGGRLKVGGWLNTGYSTGVLPITNPAFFPGPGVPTVPVLIQPTPFFQGTLPLIPAYPGINIPQTGYIDTRINIQFFAPGVVLGSRPPLSLPGLAPAAEEVDLRGVDLDVSASPMMALRKTEPAFKLAALPKPPGPDLDLPEKKLAALRMKEEPKPAVALAPAKPDAAKVEPKVEREVFDDDKLVMAGLTAFRNREYGVAVMRFRQAALSDPAAARPCFFLAQAYLAQGKYREAVFAIEDGLKRSPDWPATSFRPRDMYKTIEDEWLRHGKQLDALLATNPDHPTYLFLKGYVEWFEDHRPEALKSFTRVRPLATDAWFVDRFLAFAK